jgi:hypothetical protein
MKISELLEGRIPRKYWQPHANEASQLPSAPSLNDEPSAVDGNEDEFNDQDQEDVVDENAVRDFKQDGISIGGGIHALSAWTYPAAWSGGGYSDTRMHHITTLARELGADTAGIDHTGEQTMADDRRIEVAFFNEQTDTFFVMVASGASGEVEFFPDLSELQSSGGVTNAQMPTVKNIEQKVAAWAKTVPDGFEDVEPSGRWARTEAEVVKLFRMNDASPDSEVDDPSHPSFWRGTNTRKPPSEEGKKRGEAGMAALMARKRAEIAARKGN